MITARTPDPFEILGQSRLVPMPRPECLRKLALARVGRVAVNTLDGPLVVPVNVYAHGVDIFLRISPGSEFAEALHNPTNVSGRRLLP